MTNWTGIICSTLCMLEKCILSLLAFELAYIILTFIAYANISGGLF